MAAPQNGKAGASQGGYLSPGEGEAGAAHPSAWMALKGPQPVLRVPQGHSRDPGLLGNHAQLKHKGLLLLPLQPLPWQRWDNPAGITLPA